MATRYIAHRGASFSLPEMSRAAYQQAITEGADGFECDLRLSKDGELMLWHDRDLKRVAGEEGQIAKLTARQIQVLSHALTLPEFLDLATKANPGLTLLLETKHPVPSGGAVERKLIATLKQHHDVLAAANIQICVMSFSSMAVWRLRRLNSVQLVHHKYMYHLAKLNRAKAIGFGVHVIKKHPELVAKAKASGRQVFVWTVNQEEDVILCRRLDVDAIITDRPGFARAVKETA